MIRQDDTATIDELRGTRVVSLVGAFLETKTEYFLWYIQLNDTWYRFFIHDEILFWKPSPPDPADDLNEGEVYNDILYTHNLQRAVGASVESLAMANGVLTISLSCGVVMTFFERIGTGGMSIIARGREV